VVGLKGYSGTLILTPWPLLPLMKLTPPPLLATAWCAGIAIIFGLVVYIVRLMRT
jgi:hypothetical protein